MGSYGILKRGNNGVDFGALVPALPWQDIGFSLQLQLQLQLSSAASLLPELLNPIEG